PHEPDEAERADDEPLAVARDTEGNRKPDEDEVEEIAAHSLTVSSVGPRRAPLRPYRVVHIASRAAVKRHPRAATRRSPPPAPPVVPFGDSYGHTGRARHHVTLRMVIVTVWHRSGERCGN